MNKVLAGFQAGAVTLAFILIVAFTDVSWAIVGWSILIAGITILASIVFTGGNAIAIAIAVMIIGLMCVGIFLISGPKILAISLATGVVLGASWLITISYSFPRKITL